jgi:hypothetical protein
MVDIQLPRNRPVDYILSRAPSIFSLEKFLVDVEESKPLSGGREEIWREMNSHTSYCIYV